MLIYVDIADLGLAVLFAVLALVTYFYVRRRWRISTARRQEIRRLTWLAAVEAERAEEEASELAYSASPAVKPSLLEVDVKADNVKVRDGMMMQQCVVCYRHTTTRCSRCKTVRYCSGKCQIIHWRQGHKDKCRPPINEEQNNDGESACTYNTKTTENHVDVESRTQLKSPETLPVESTEPTLQSTSNSCISSLSSSPSLSSCSSFSLSDDDFGSDDHPATQSEKINKNSFPELLSRDPMPGDNSDQDACQSSSVEGNKEPLIGSNLGISSTEPEIHDTNLIDRKMDYSEADVTEFCTNGTTNIPTSAVPAVADETKENFHNKVAMSSFPSSFKSSTLKTKSLDQDYSIRKASSASTAELNHYTANEKSTDVWLLRARSAKPSSTILPENPGSLVGRKHSASLNGPSKNSNITSSSSVKMPRTNESAPSGVSELKTSVRRVVQSLKPPNILKHPSGVSSDIPQKDKISFPYDLFVKLYCDKVEMRPTGLINCGNSCYANAVLQCLAFTRPLTSYLVQGLHTKICPKEDWCFTCEFESLLKKAKQGQFPLSPAMILSNIHNIGGSLGHGREEDAHEFLRYAIDTMQSACLKAGTKAYGSREEEATLINLIFGGYLHSMIKCTRCRGKSERHERMMDLTVEINGNVETLEEALTLFTSTEILDGENKYNCSRCKSYERAKKKLSILEAPNVLTIALKRFQSGKFGKLNKTVKYPEILNLAPYMHLTDDKFPVYSLYAVVVHQDIMNATFSGHYVSYVKSAHGKWYKTDDSKVKPVELAKVLSKNAYMLFYTRCSPRAPSSIRNAIDSKLSRSFRLSEKKLPFHRTNSYSDSSSVFSNSDEGSCGTETSTRNSSTSTEELSDYMRGDSDVCAEENGASYDEGLGWGRSRDSGFETRKFTVDCRGRGSHNLNTVLITRVLPKGNQGTVQTFY